MNDFEKNRPLISKNYYSKFGGGTEDARSGLIASIFDTDLSWRLIL